MLLMACNKEEPIVTATGIPVVYKTSTYGVKVEKGIEYAQGQVHSNWNSDVYSAKSLTLDIYEPDDATSENRPAIVIFHGGGFYGGDSEKETKFNSKRIINLIGKTALKRSLAEPLSNK